MTVNDNVIPLTFDNVPTTAGVKEWWQQHYSPPYLHYPTPPHQNICPGCGRCSCCGRSGREFYGPYWGVDRWSTTY